MNRVAIATCKLVCRLVKQGTMRRSEVAEILFQESDSETSAFSLSQFDSTAYKFDIHERSRGQTEKRDICNGVAARLAALRDRILAAGKAALPPSRAVMGPPFVPALDFLRRLVLDAAEPAAAAAAAEIAAEIAAAGPDCTASRAVGCKRLRQSGP